MYANDYDENRNANHSDNESMSNYENWEIELVAEELERLKAAQRRLKELEPPTIPKELTKKTKDTPSSGHKTARESQRPLHTSQKASSPEKNSAQASYPPSTAAKSTAKNTKQHNSSCVSRTSSRTTQEKSKMTLRKPLLLTRKYYFSGANKLQRKSGGEKSKMKKEEGNVTYRIYANAFKIHKPSYHQA
eukprot:TRINITY_DN15715_c0_g1_i2.p2 TRINITY_DN15715_c0_g1~~TRINITY_DN15715_c0_g1_i2.p2  ORF type:complete len:190 (+),score=58.20 TRINITY_DN15715_c0_g1_i2:186-755(+)